VNEADSCVYYWYGGGQEVILCLYVDDILIFGSSLGVIEEVKKFLSNNFVKRKRVQRRIAWASLGLA
jgi:hypothetical protein